MATQLARDEFDNRTSWIRGKWREAGDIVRDFERGFHAVTWDGSGKLKRRSYHPAIMPASGYKRKWRPRSSYPRKRVKYVPRVRQSGHAYHRAHVPKVAAHLRGHNRVISLKRYRRRYRRRRLRFPTRVRKHALGLFEGKRYIKTVTTEAARTVNNPFYYLCDRDWDNA